MTATGSPVQWNSPMGFPIEQPYWQDNPMSVRLAWARTLLCICKRVLLAGTDARAMQFPVCLCKGGVQRAIDDDEVRHSASNPNVCSLTFSVARMHVRMQFRIYLQGGCTFDVACMRKGVPTGMRVCMRRSRPPCRASASLGWRTRGTRLARARALTDSRVA